MDWREILTSASVGIITGVIGYLSGRPKNKAETKKTDAEAISIEISSLRDIIESWKDHSSDLEKQIDRQNKIMKQQRTDLNEMKKKIKELGDQVQSQCDSCNHNKP